VVEGILVVTTKTLTFLDKCHVARVISYLAVSGCTVGLLLDFGERSLGYRRILPPQDILEHRVNRQWLFVPNSSKQR